VTDSPSLWELRRKSLARARKRWRSGDAEGLHDFRVALRRVAATAAALGRRKLERRAEEIVRGLSSDRQGEVDRALLARIRELGLLSEDAATVLEIRWKPGANSAAEMENGAGERRLRRLTRKLRALERRAPAGALHRLLVERRKAEALLAKAPGNDDDRGLHRYRLRVKRARYLAEDLAACGRLEYEAAVSRERSAQDDLGRWNDLRLFLERIARERKRAERRGAVRLAAELEQLARSLAPPLAGLRRTAAETARRLAASSSPADRFREPRAPKKEPGAGGAAPGRSSTGPTS
jgi:CHAD domain-containing protein